MESPAPDTGSEKSERSLPHGRCRFNKLLETELKKAAVAFVLATASVLAMAQATPAGLWKSIDDDGKTEKSIIRITNTNGIYSGKVEKISDPAKADEKCVKCDDERKDKPIVGMTIIWEVRQNAEEPGLFDGGQIL